MFDFLWSPEFQRAISTVVILFVGLFTTALLGQGASWFRTHVKGDELTYLQTIAAIAVRAAEQGKLAGILQDKKASAMAAVQSVLDAAKITGFTAHDIEVAIEAAVHDFNQSQAYSFPSFDFPTTPTEPTNVTPSVTEDDGA